MPSDQKSDEGMYMYRLIDDKKYLSKKKKGKLEMWLKLSLIFNTKLKQL